MTSPESRSLQETPEVEPQPPPARSRPAPPAVDLEAVRSRDREALAALFDAYCDRLYSWAYRWLGDTFASEDAVQEVFLRVHRAAETLDARRDPWPWLMAIATNVCRDVWRSAGRQLSQPPESIEGEPGNSPMGSTHAQAPDEAAQDREREKIVQAAVLALPENQRTVVLLRDYAGLRHDEIAELTGASAVAARKTYSRALAALGAILEERLG